MSSHFDELMKKKLTALSQQLVKSNEAFSAKVAKLVQEIAPKVQASFVQM